MYRVNIELFGYDAKQAERIRDIIRHSMRQLGTGHPDKDIGPATLITIHNDVSVTDVDNNAGAYIRVHATGNENEFREEIVKIVNHLAFRLQIKAEEEDKTPEILHLQFIDTSFRSIYPKNLRD